MAIGLFDNNYPYASDPKGPGPEIDPRMLLGQLLGLQPQSPDWNWSSKYGAHSFQQSVPSTENMPNYYSAEPMSPLHSILSKLLGI